MSLLADDWVEQNEENIFSDEFDFFYQSFGSLSAD